MNPFLALIAPLGSGLGETPPGTPTHPIVIPPVPPLRPSHPIVIPPGALGPGVPSHPIVLPPAMPDHPIVIPPDAIEPGVPSHPIVLPPVLPEHPIVIPPDAIMPGLPSHPIYLPVAPSHPIAPGGGDVFAGQFVWVYAPGQGWVSGYLPAEGSAAPKC